MASIQMTAFRNGGLQVPKNVSLTLTNMKEFPVYIRNTRTEYYSMSFSLANRHQHWRMKQTQHPSGWVITITALVSQRVPYSFSYLAYSELYISSISIPSASVQMSHCSFLSYGLADIIEVSQWTILKILLQKTKKHYTFHYFLKQTWEIFLGLDEHDVERPRRKQMWVQSLKNKRNSLCCKRKKGAIYHSTELQNTGHAPESRPAFADYLCNCPQTISVIEIFHMWKSPVYLVYLVFRFY